MLCGNTALKKKRASFGRRLSHIFSQLRFCDWAIASAFVYEHGHFCHKVFSRRGWKALVFSVLRCKSAEPRTAQWRLLPAVSSTAGGKKNFGGRESGAAHPVAALGQPAAMCSSASASAADARQLRARQQIRDHLLHLHRTHAEVDDV